MLNVVLLLGVFWTIYGLIGVIGFQVVPKRYRHKSWTRKYARLRGAGWIMIGVPWVLIYGMAVGLSLPRFVMVLLFVLAAIPSLVYTLIIEKKYETLWVDEMEREEKKAQRAARKAQVQAEMEPRPQKSNKSRSGKKKKK